MSENCRLEKTLWDEGDFEQMGWHDATIYGIAFGPGDFELCLDIDYIFKWVHPLDGEENFQFWVCPCTMVFENVYDLQIEADPYGGPTMSIDSVTRTDSRRPKNAEHIGKDTEWRWTLDCHHGEIAFRSVGYKQYVRRAPVQLNSQSIEMTDRGGFCFDRDYDQSESGGD